MINNTLKERRIIAGLTQSQLAQRVGVGQSVVAQWEKGLKRPSAKNQLEIDSVLDSGDDDIYFQIANNFGALSPEDREILKDLATPLLVVGGDVVGGVS